MRRRHAVPYAGAPSPASPRGRQRPDAQRRQQERALVHRVSATGRDQLSRTTRGGGSGPETRTPRLPRASLCRAAHSSPAPQTGRGRALHRRVTEEDRRPGAVGLRPYVDEQVSGAAERITPSCTCSSGRDSSGRRSASAPRRRWWGRASASSPVSCPSQKASLQTSRRSSTYPTASTRSGPRTGKEGSSASSKPTTTD